MRSREEICLILMILGFISRNPLVTGDRYMSVYDASRRPLCAVAAPSNTTLKSSAIFWKTSDSVACARSCWNSSDCIMFNVYANGSCELFNRCSYGLFQSVNCCQAFSVTPWCVLSCCLAGFWSNPKMPNSVTVPMHYFSKLLYPLLLRNFGIINQPQNA